jgi:hypothetical protein
VYNADCAGNDVCINGVCHAFCQSDADCPAHDRCDSGVCNANHDGAPQCRANADCPAGKACVNAVCRSACISSEDCCTCQTATICQRGYCITPGEAAPMCQAQTACPSGQSCIDAECSAGP